MSDDTLNGADNQAAGPAFTVEKVYIKDVSFEAPGTPQVFNEAGQPQLQMNLNQQVQRLAETVFEVVLGVTLTCTVADKTAYLVEVQQAGVFSLAGFATFGRHPERLAGAPFAAAVYGWMLLLAPRVQILVARF